MEDEKLREELQKLIKVVDKAIMMERNARTFYLHAARRVDAVEGKKMFEWLADFEAGHESRLMARRRDLFSHPAMEGVAPYPVQDDSLSEAKPVEVSSEPSDTQVLMIAIENEQIAKSYYEANGAHSVDEELKIAFQRMANEEERHIKILSEQLKHLQVDRFWVDLAAFDETKKRQDR
jgi:rubrerythrin